MNVPTVIQTWRNLLAIYEQALSRAYMNCDSGEAEFYTAMCECARRELVRLVVECMEVGNDQPDT